jgi:hypothetical protein
VTNGHDQGPLKIMIEKKKAPHSILDYSRSKNK